MNNIVYFVNNSFNYFVKISVITYNYADNCKKKKL